MGFSARGILAVTSQMPWLQQTSQKTLKTVVQSVKGNCITVFCVSLLKITLGFATGDAEEKHLV